MNRLNRRHSLALLASSWMAATSSPVFAQAAPWSPRSPFRMIAAGGVNEAIARAVAEKLSRQLGQPVNLEFSEEERDLSAMDAVAKRAADGYTFGFTGLTPLAVHPHLGTTPFDPMYDLAPVSYVMYAPILLLASRSSRARDFRDLMGRAKDKPKSVEWATTGLGTQGRMMFEHLQHAGKVTMVNVPYKTAAQQLAAGLSGKVEVLTAHPTPEVMAHIKAGRLRPLAVAAPQRLGGMQGVPTLAQVGYARANVTSNYGIFVQRKTAPEVVQRLGAEFNQLLQQPDILERLRAAGLVPMGSGAGELKTQLATESDFNYQLIRAAGLKAA